MLWLFVLLVVVWIDLTQRLDQMEWTSATQGRTQMAFAQDVLDKIAAQTTLIGSIKAWILALPSDQVSDAQKATILANLDANQAELETAIPANTPLA